MARGLSRGGATDRFEAWHADERCASVGPPLRRARPRRQLGSETTQVTGEAVSVGKSGAAK